MSTTNNAKKYSNSIPWKDWKLDSEFLSEANKYCEGPDRAFSKLIEDLIKKAEEGVNLFGNLLVSISHSFFA